MKPYLGPVLLVVILLVAIFFLLSYLRFHQEITEARQRFGGMGSQVMETARGPMEFTTDGEGYPVIVVHGVWGGFDQGLFEAQRNFGLKYRSIVVSRFGYLRTPMPESATPALQADAYEALLDGLGIERAAIIGISAGGTSAIQFALRHPDRCTALILKSTNVPKNQPPPSGFGQFIIGSLAESDFLLWLIMTYSPGTMMSLAGIPEELQWNLTESDRKDFAELSRTFLPTSLRAKGIIFDIYTSNPDIDSYPLEKISVPTLILHARDDPMPPYMQAKGMAKRIPHAEFVGYSTGGHILLGHNDEIRKEIDRFLREHIQTAKSI